MKTIPKVCYLMWTSEAPMALLQVFTVVSFHKYNPDWKIIVYLSKQTEKELGSNIYVPEYMGKDYFYMVKNLDYVEIIEHNLIESGVSLGINAIVASDIIKRKLMYEFGGVYSDFDVIWLKPMSEFSNIDCIGDPMDFESVVSFFRYTQGHHNVSNLISEKGSPYIYSLIEYQKNITPPYDHQSFGTQMLNDKYPDLASITSIFPRVLAIKYETFYPYSIFKLEQLYLENDLSPLNSKNVMCIHWFNGHQLSKNYLNNDGLNTNCSMTSVLKKEGLL